MAKTKPEFTMAGIGVPFVFPWGNTAITVEVYLVECPEMLQSLDRLEGHPNNYTRTPIQLEDGEWVEMYIWDHPLNGDVYINGTGDFAETPTYQQHFNYHYY